MNPCKIYAPGCGAAAPPGGAGPRGRVAPTSGGVGPLGRVAPGGAGPPIVGAAGPRGGGAPARSYYTHGAHAHQRASYRLLQPAGVPDLEEARLQALLQAAWAPEPAVRPQGRGRYSLVQPPPAHCHRRLAASGPVGADQMVQQLDVAVAAQLHQSCVLVR
jgi:hypothetical protein